MVISGRTPTTGRPHPKGPKIVSLPSLNPRDFHHSLDLTTPSMMPLYCSSVSPSPPPLTPPPPHTTLSSHIFGRLPLREVLVGWIESWPEEFKMQGMLHTASSLTPTASSVLCPHGVATSGKTSPTLLQPIFFNVALRTDC